jgi:pimeloyl-ACP methyl ester carboxylesterase
VAGSFFSIQSFISMPRRRFGKKLFKSFLPILLVLVLACVIALASIVHGITRPPRQAYLVTPQSFSQLSGSALAAKVTDESWRNRDGTAARGWLLRGTEGAPAVVFLHRYGGDRSWLFNLGIKLNEATGFSILWPDLRGHGVNPPVAASTLGLKEGEDLLSALDFLRGLKGSSREHLTADFFGVYGIELGAYAAISAAAQDSSLRVLVLDSVPRSSDELMDAMVTNHLGVANKAVLCVARFATRVYFMGQYRNSSSCQMASELRNPRILLLAGADDGYLRNSTADVQLCFLNKANVDAKLDLPLTGFSLPSATGEQGEGYDRPVIDFFAKNLL